MESKTKKLEQQVIDLSKENEKLRTLVSLHTDVFFRMVIRIERLEVLNLDTAKKLIAKDMETKFQNRLNND